MRRKRILFMSYYGSQYGCSPKYLSQYMVASCLGWDIVWVFTNPEKYEIDGVRKVRYLSLRYFYELCTAQVIVTNYRMTKLFRKRKNQLYIQTWHSSLRLKAIEQDAESTLPPHYVEMAKHDSSQTDVFLSGCRCSTEIFERAAWFKGPIISSGTPRIDVLMSRDEALTYRVKQNLCLAATDHVLLYAPTFRKGNSLKYYDIDFEGLTAKLKAVYGGQWRVLVRLHPHLRDFSHKLLKDHKDILDATLYDDIQELLYVSDIVISDYSSLIFDFALTRRMCILYVPDLDEYTHTDRKLYFDIDKLPFPKARNNAELLGAFTEFNRDVYKKNLDSFLENVGSYETGHASKNVVDFIEHWIRKH